MFQTNLYLQGEGVATLNNIAVSDQIWGASNLTMTYRVNGVYKMPHTKYVFSSAFAAFESGPESLQQAASTIGAFYSFSERPGLNRGETYGIMYTGAAQNEYKNYMYLISLHNEEIQNPAQYERTYQQTLQILGYVNGGDQ